MIDYLQKFRLDGKTAFVIGGVGLIGREVTTAFASAGANTVIPDLEEEKGKALVKELDEAGYPAHLRSFDCGDMEHLETNFSSLLYEFGPPDVYINCSYPRTNDWGKSSFNEVLSPTAIL